MAVLAVQAAWVAGCGGQSGSDGSSDAWRHAEELWRAREVAAAFRAFRDLDTKSPEGREAHRRLGDADRHFRRGIELLRAGASGVREEIAVGLATAPMDPALYLPLARACRDRGLSVRAAEYYRKYLDELPAASEAEAEAEAGAARAELAAVDPDFDLFDGPTVAGGQAVLERREDRSKVMSPTAAPLRLSTRGMAVFAALALPLVTVGFFGLRRRRPSLSELARERPELHPVIAWSVDCLRHELLKHRIGAVAEAVRALAASTATAEERRFVHARLFQGEPLMAAWRGHLRALEKALGLRVALERSDRRFRLAGRAIATIDSLAASAVNGDARHAARLERATLLLHAFDRELSSLTASLVRTTVDEALFGEAVSGVRSEYAASRVALDELAIGAVESGVAVDVYRTDLLIILRNLLRNAILAVGRSDGPRRVGLDLCVDLEPTGVEVVRIRIRDTNPEPISVEALQDWRAGHGLGIVTEALRRYDGALEVGPGADGYRKAVIVRLFRALDGVVEAPPTVGERVLVVA